MPRLPNNKDLAKLARLPCDTIILLEADWNGEGCAQPELWFGVNKQFAEKSAQVRAKVAVEGQRNCEFDLHDSVFIDEYGTFELFLPKDSVALCLRLKIHKDKCEPIVLEGVFARSLCSAPLNPCPVDCATDSLIVCSKDCKLERKRLSAMDLAPIDCERDHFLVCTEKQTCYGTAHVLEQRTLDITDGEPIDCVNDRLLVCTNDADGCHLMAKPLDIGATASPIHCTQDKLLVCEMDDQGTRLVAKSIDNGSSAALECGDHLLVCADGNLESRSISTAAAIECNALLLVCNGSQIQMAPLSQTSSIDCQAEFLLCQQGQIVRASIPRQTVSLRCDDELLICDGSSYAFATIPEPTESFSCDGASGDKWLVCDADGNVQQRLLSLTTVPFQQGRVLACTDFGIALQELQVPPAFECPALEVTSVQTADGFLICDGADLHTRPIRLVNDPISCADEFVVSDGTEFQRKLFPLPSADFECNGPPGGKSADKLIACDSDGNLQQRTISITSSPFESGLVLTCQDSGLTLQPLDLPEPFSCPVPDNQCIQGGNAFLVCDGTAIQSRPIAATTSPLDCADLFVVSADDCLVRKQLSVTTTLFETGIVLTCENNELTLQPLVLPEPFSCPEVDEQCLGVGNAFLVCDGTALQSRLLDFTSEPLLIADEFVVAAGDCLVRKAVPSATADFRCGDPDSDAWLVCDAQGEIKQRLLSVSSTPFQQGNIVVCSDNGLILQPFTAAALEFVCPELNGCLGVGDSILVCDGTTLTARALDSTSEPMFCDEEFVVTQGGCLVRKRIGPADEAFDCNAPTGAGSANDAFVVCDSQGQLQQRLLGITTVPFLEGSIIVCTEDGLAVQPFIPNAIAFTCPPLDGSFVQCDEGFLVCADGIPKLRQLSVTDVPFTGGQIVVCGPLGLELAPFQPSAGGFSCPELPAELLNCDDAFLVCNGNLDRKQLATGLSLLCEQEFVVCDGSGVLGLASIAGPTLHQIVPEDADGGFFDARTSSAVSSNYAVIGAYFELQVDTGFNRICTTVDTSAATMFVMEGAYQESTVNSTFSITYDNVLLENVALPVGFNNQTTIQIPLPPAARGPAVSFCFTVTTDGPGAASWFFRALGWTIGIGCNDGFLVCDGSSGQMVVKNIGLNVPLRCDSEFLVCQDGQLHSASLCSDPTVEHTFRFSDIPAGTSTSFFSSFDVVDMNDTAFNGSTFGSDNYFRINGVSTANPGSLTLTTKPIDCRCIDTFSIVRTFSEFSTNLASFEVLINGNFVADVTNQLSTTVGATPALEISLHIPIPLADQTENTTFSLRITVDTGAQEDVPFFWYFYALAFGTGPAACADTFLTCDGDGQLKARPFADGDGVQLDLLNSTLLACNQNRVTSKSLRYFAPVIYSGSFAAIDVPEGAQNLTLSVEVDDIPLLANSSYNVHVSLPLSTDSISSWPFVNPSTAVSSVVVTSGTLQADSVRIHGPNSADPISLQLATSTDIDFVLTSLEPLTNDSGRVAFDIQSLGKLVNADQSVASWADGDAFSFIVTVESVAQTTGSQSGAFS